MSNSQDQIKEELDKLIGKTFVEAKTSIESLGLRVRVRDVNACTTLGTADFRTDRVNLFIEAAPKNLVFYEREGVKSNQINIRESKLEDALVKSY